MTRPLLLAPVLLLAACPDPEPRALSFDQAPEISVEAGESVNLSLSWSEGPFDEDSVAWSADCGEVMGLLVRGSYLAPDVAGDCVVTATNLADPAMVATLPVVVTAPAGGGAVRWTRHVASDHNDAVRHLAPAADGGFVALIDTEGDLAGDLDGTPLGEGDVVVMRFASDGSALWATRVATPSREFAGGLAVGPDGVVWAVGSTYGSFDSAAVGDQDAFLARLEPDGTLAWVQAFGTDAPDAATGVALAPDGDLFVAGWTEGALAGPSVGASDGYVRRFAPDGTARWTRSFGSLELDFAIGVAADGEDAVVVGTTHGQVGDAAFGGMDGYLARITGDGSTVSLTQYGGSGDDRSYGVAARPGGGVIVVGAAGIDGFVDAWTREGDRSWRFDLASAGEDLAQAVAVAPSGDVLVAGMTSGDLGSPNVGFFDAFALRLAPDGAARWTRRLGSAADDYGWAIAALSDGDAVFGGRTDGILAGEFGMGGDAFLRRVGP